MHKGVPSIGNQYRYARELRRPVRPRHLVLDRTPDHFELPYASLSLRQCGQPGANLPPSHASRCKLKGRITGFALGLDYPTTLYRHNLLLLRRSQLAIHLAVERVLHLSQARARTHRPHRRPAAAARRQRPHRVQRQLRAGASYSAAGEARRGGARGTRPPGEHRGAARALPAAPVCPPDPRCSAPAPAADTRRPRRAGRAARPSAVGQ